MQKQHLPILVICYIKKLPVKLAIAKTEVKDLFVAVGKDQDEFVSIFSFKTFLKLNKLDNPENIEKIDHLVQFLTNNHMLRYKRINTLNDDVKLII